MPRSCSVCERPDVVAINDALARGGAVREIARQYELGRDALTRHAANHIDSAPAIQEETAPAETSHNVTLSDGATPDNAQGGPLHTVTFSSRSPFTHNGQSGEPRAFAPLPGMVFPPDVERDAIVQHIQTRLGPDLGKVYADAIRSSVETGCYDREFKAGPPYVRIEHYLEILKKDWMVHQGDLGGVMARLLFLLSFGTQEQKAALRELDLVPVAGNG